MYSAKPRLSNLSRKNSVSDQEFQEIIHLKPETEELVPKPETKVIRYSGDCANFILVNFFSFITTLQFRATIPTIYLSKHVHFHRQSMPGTSTMITSPYSIVNGWQTQLRRPRSVGTRLSHP